MRHQGTRLKTPAQAGWLPGDTIVAGSIECSSTPDGITCWDFVYGGEFSIARQAYHLA